MQPDRSDSRSNAPRRSQLGRDTADVLGHFVAAYGERRRDLLIDLAISDVARRLRIEGQVVYEPGDELEDEHRVDGVDLTVAIYV